MYKRQGEYPYAVESLEGIGAEELEGICRRLSGKPWEILRTERLIVREQKEEDLDILYAVSYTHLDVYKIQPESCHRTGGIPDQ